MSDVILIGAPGVEVHVRDNPRAKRYTLRVSPRDRKIWLTIPKGGTRSAGANFAASKTGWLQTQAAKLAAPAASLRLGDRIPIEGQEKIIVPGKGRTAKISGPYLEVPGRDEQVAPRVKSFLKTRARDILVPRSEAYAKQIGRKFGRVTMRDTSSRWGSCTSRGDLMYSIRLAMAPIEVADYVAAHEICHLIEMNHSSRFWGLVEQICPDYDSHRKWLKTHGVALQKVPLT